MKMHIRPRDKNGNPHGYWEVYHQNGGGNLCYKGNFIHGKEHGYWETYFDNGDLRDKGYWINENRYELWVTLKNKFIL